MKKLTFIIILSIITAWAGRAQTTNLALARQYYAQGEFDKALDLYQKLAKKSANWAVIHNQYYSLLIQQGEYQQAEKYINKLTKAYPKNPRYLIDKGKLLVATKGEARAKQYYASLRNRFASDPYQARQAAQYYLQNGERTEAVEVLLLSRKKSGDPTLFALDLANIYRYMNKKQDMMQEYIVFVNANPANMRYVKNALQVTLPNPEDIEALESYLYSKIQDEPENTVYIELLIWANMQTKNFMGAFMQARALDRRMKQQGVHLLEIGKMALANKDYPAADKIFSYIENYYAQTNRGIEAGLWRITTKEEQVKNTYPVNKQELEELTRLYQAFIKEYPANPLAYKAQLQLALIQGYYLQQKEKAIVSLQTLIANPLVNSQLRAEAKLTLADIYLLKQEPWEATLLYAQVDKTMKETPVGYKAKLKRAKLAYYQGEFELAQAILDILKLATSRQIANDALDLSIFIKENTLFDSTHYALKVYAGLELELYQHKNQEVLARLDTIITYFEGQSLADDFMFLKANELKKAGHYQQAADTYGQIVAKYTTGVLADKSLFLQAELYQKYLHNSLKAQALYVQLLKQYPGSIYVAEARKQYRILRGDFKPTS